MLCNVQLQPGRYNEHATQPPHITKPHSTIKYDHITDFLCSVKDYCTCLCYIVVTLSPVAWSGLYCKYDDDESII